MKVLTETMLDIVMTYRNLITKLGNQSIDLAWFNHTSPFYHLTNWLAELHNLYTQNFSARLVKCETI